MTSREKDIVRLIERDGRSGDIRGREEHGRRNGIEGVARRPLEGDHLTWIRKSGLGRCQCRGWMIRSGAQRQG